MKSILFFLSFIFLFSNPLLYSQATYKGLPVIKTNTDRIKYYINSGENNWTVTPNVPDDSLFIKTYFTSKFKMTIKFKTDIDSIKFDIDVNETKRFYILLRNESYALTTVRRERIYIPNLKFSLKKTTNRYHFLYTDEAEKKYLDSLKFKYPINLDNAKTQLDQILEILNWTSKQWVHDGNANPRKSDAISILNEVKEGGRFPCFAYAIVLAAQLKAAGFKSRVIYLKTMDISTSTKGGGHVATEVFVDELQKWVFVDAQFNVMPVLENKPLNAVELQKAIRTDFDKLEFKSLGRADKVTYIHFVQQYLYFFDYSFDQRIGVSKETSTGNAKRNLMLVPLGANNPTSMLVWNTKIDYCAYTNSIKDFYSKPAKILKVQ